MTIASDNSSARELTYLEAIWEAEHEELERDDSVFLIGEDVKSNLYGTTRGFVEDFGEHRIRNTPLSEAGIVGAGVGAAMAGMRPIVDLTFASFIFCAMDQVISQAAKSRYMFGGQTSVPLVIRAAMYYGGRATAAHHSDRPYPMLMNMPGLKIITPSTPADMKGLLKSAIRDDDPVLCFEDCTLWPRRLRGPVPEGRDHVVPLGSAAVRRRGTDVTVVAIAGTGVHALSAAQTLAEEGISVEVVDPRSLVPMDWPTIVNSIAKTGNLVVVDPAHRTCSAASEIVATAFEELGSQLRRARRITTPDLLIPFSPALEKGMYPDSKKIADTIRAMVG